MLTKEELNGKDAPKFSCPDCKTRVMVSISKYRNLMGYCGKCKYNRSLNKCPPIIESHKEAKNKNAEIRLFNEYDFWNEYFNTDFEKINLKIIDDQ